MTRSPQQREGRLDESKLRTKSPSTLNCRCSLTTGLYLTAIAGIFEIFYLLILITVLQIVNSASVDRAEAVTYLRNATKLSKAEVEEELFRLIDGNVIVADPGSVCVLVLVEFLMTVFGLGHSCMGVCACIRLLVSANVGNIMPGATCAVERRITATQDELDLTGQ